MGLDLGKLTKDIWGDEFVEGKRSDAPIQLTNPIFTQNAVELAKLVMPNLKPFASSLGSPYSGQLTAGPVPAQEQAFKSLEQFLMTPTATDTPLFGAASNELQKTLEGDYDPFKGEYYQAYQANLKKELREAQNRLRSSLGARGRLDTSGSFEGSRTSRETQLESETMNNLAQVLGQLYENERSRRLGAVPLAQGLLGFGDQSNIGRIGAGLQLGEVQRGIQNEGLLAALNEYMRQRGELQFGLNLATGGSVGYAPEYYQPTYGPSMFGQLLGAASTAAIAAA